MSSSSPNLSSSIASVVIPAITPREAERLIDLLGQLQAALWEVHGEAILAAADDPTQDEVIDEHSSPSSPDDDSPF
jgi:hypothetical protein